MDKHPVEKGIEDVVKTYELLDRIRLGRDIVIRDDQFDREALFDAAHRARSKRIRVNLLDTGRFEASELEWLAEERVRFYTSDEARRGEAELSRVLKACRTARSFLAYFQNGSLEDGAGAPGISLSGLRNLVSSGVDLHLSNRIHARESGVLKDFADDAREGKCFLVYYHHGALTVDMTELAGRGAWIHFSDRNLGASGAADLGSEIVRSASAAGSRVAITVEQGLPLSVLEHLFEAGAVVLFQTPPSDGRSLQKPFEAKARKRNLPARAFYLSTAFLP
jgi:hypothetical protein